jgi:hypothetical protein
VNDQVEIYEKAWTEQHTHVAASEVERWQKPPVGTIKLNWDASVDVGANKMGMGMAARDHTGELVASFCATLEFITDPKKKKFYDE